MSNSATAPVRAEHRGRERGARGPAGRLVVGDHVGQPAAEAAQAVRRAGLRPGLDRSLGCDANLVGLIVAQDPPAGGELARNAMVTLYVAAPGPALTQETAEPDIHRDDQPARFLIAAEAELGQTDAAPPQESARRPRKPRLAAGARTEAFEPPSEPKAPIQQSAGREEPPLGQEPTAPRWDVQPYAEEPRSHAFQEAVLPETGEQELPHEEFTVHREDVFAGRAGELPAWRRVYPRKGVAATLRRPLAWAAAHPVLATTTCAMLIVWAAIAVMSTLAGRPSHTPSASAISRREPDTRFPKTTGGRVPARARTVRPTSSGSAGTQDRAAPPRPAPAKAGRRTARPVKASVQPASGSPPSSPPGAVRAPSVPAQSSGGPFSP